MRRRRNWPQAGAEVAVCDLDDPAAVKAALGGAHGLFLYQPGFMSPELTPGLGPDSELTRGRTVISAAQPVPAGQLA